MGEKYIGSELDKFRLNHREEAVTSSGHPWDGEREFIAEVGSALLVDSEARDKLFDSKTDKLSLETLDYFKAKLSLKNEKV
jgi:hypothetical protein